MGISSKFTMKIWEIMGDLMRQFSKLVIHAVHLTAFYHLTFRYTAVYLIYWVIQSSEMRRFFHQQINSISRPSKGNWNRPPHQIHRHNKQFLPELKCPPRDPISTFVVDSPPHNFDNIVLQDMGIKILELWAINTNGELPFKYTIRQPTSSNRLKKILTYDLMKCSRTAYVISTLPAISIASPRLKKILKFDLMKSSRMALSILDV